MAKHEYYVVQGKTLDNVAETMKTVLGVDKDTPIRFDEITNNEKAEQVTENVDVQAEVIEQIKAALNGKSSVGVKEIMDIIDQSEVLDSTDGTATEKVEQLIDKAEYGNIFYEQSGVWKSYDSLFANSPLKKLPKLKFSNCTNVRYLISESAIEEVDYYIVAPNLTPNSCHIFHSAKNLKRAVGFDTSKLTSAYGLCFGCALLETVQEPFDFTNVTNTSAAFSSANSLRNIRFVAETIKVSISIPSPVLSNDSIKSIIDGLGTVETAQTLTLHKDVKAKLTEEQLATITSKNWNLA